MADKVRVLKRQEPNKRCVDCSVGFTTDVVFLPNDHAVFACSTCAGLHRQYSHRVKSISLADFSDSEYQILSSSGNQHVNSIYLASHNASTQSIPTKSDTKALKQFLENKYIKKKWVSSSVTRTASSPSTRPPLPSQTSTPASFDNFFTDVPEFASKDSFFDTKTQDTFFDDSFAPKKPEPKTPKSADILSIFDGFDVSSQSKPKPNRDFDMFDSQPTTSQSPSKSGKSQLFDCDDFDVSTRPKPTQKHDFDMFDSQPTTSQSPSKSGKSQLFDCDDFMSSEPPSVKEVDPFDDLFADSEPQTANEFDLFGGGPSKKTDDFDDLFDSFSVSSTKESVSNANNFDFF
ncbi:hypothetical protein GEMRC1_011969 [Eukaryota sp. GEM-RC1]